MECELNKYTLLSLFLYNITFNLLQLYLIFIHFSYCVVRIMCALNHFDVLFNMASV